MKIIPDHWIKQPDEKHNGFLEAWAESGEVSFPVPIETHNVSMDDVTLNEEQNFEILIESYSEIEVFADEDDCMKRRKTHFAPESFVPAGLFSPVDDKNFVQSARAIIGGKIIETFDDPTPYGFDDDDVIFVLTCLGYEMCGVIHKCVADIEKLEVGNYISGIFWVQGWPDEDEN